MVAHDADHAHGLVVDGLADAFGIDLEGVAGRRDEAGLDVEVLEELLPRRLVAGGDDDVGADGADLVVAQPVELLVPGAPAELEGEPGEQAGLRGADGAGAGIDAVLVEVVGLGAVPEGRDHVHHRVVDRVGLGIDGLVREVDLQPHQRDLLLLGLEAHVHVRRRVELLVEVEGVGVLDQRLDGLGGQSSVGHVSLARQVVLRVRREVVARVRLLAGAVEFVAQGRDLTLQVVDLGVAHVGAPLRRRDLDSAFPGRSRPVGAAASGERAGWLEGGGPENGRRRRPKN